MPHELWKDDILVYLIFKHLWPTDIVSVRLTCKRFNTLVMTLKAPLGAPGASPEISKAFEFFWPHTEYYQVLLGKLENKDIDMCYDVCPLKKEYVGNDGTDIDMTCRPLAVCAKYADFERMKHLFNNFNCHEDCHEETIGWILEKAVTSKNLKFIKYMYDFECCTIDYCTHCVVAEGIDTEDGDIFEYLFSKVTCTYDALYLLLHCGVKNNIPFAKIIITKFPDTLLEKGLPADFWAFIEKLKDTLSVIPFPDGIILPATCLDVVRDLDLIKLCPGIRLDVTDTSNNQTQIATPEEAIKGGADYLVIGSPITKSDDMAKSL